MGTTESLQNFRYEGSIPSGCVSVVDPNKRCRELHFQRKCGKISRLDYYYGINDVYATLVGRDKDSVDFRISRMHPDYPCRDAGGLATSYYDNSHREAWLARMWAERYGIRLEDYGVDNSGMFLVRMRNGGHPDYIAHLMDGRSQKVEIKFTNGPLTLRPDQLTSYINQGAGILLFKTYGPMIGSNGDPHKDVPFTIEPGQLWIGWASAHTLKRLMEQVPLKENRNQSGTASYQIRFDDEFKDYFKLRRW